MPSGNIGRTGHGRHRTGGDAPGRVAARFGRGRVDAGSAGRRRGAEVGEIGRLGVLVEGRRRAGPASATSSCGAVLDEGEGDARAAAGVLEAGEARRPAAWSSVPVLAKTLPSTGRAPHALAAACRVLPGDRQALGRAAESGPALSSSASSVSHVRRLPSSRPEPSLMIEALRSGCRAGPGSSLVAGDAVGGRARAARSAARAPWSAARPWCCRSSAASR